MRTRSPTGRRTMKPMAPLVVLVCAGMLAAACSTAGSTWIAEPLYESDKGGWEQSGTAEAEDSPIPPRFGGTRSPLPGRQAVILHSDPRPEPLEAVGAVAIGAAATPKLGRDLGTFRNTYYDFPNEGDFEGEPVSLMNAQCQVIEQVPRAFFETVCVQGSGMLSSGTPVSFNRRDCSCAEVCPRTHQKICFDALDAATFPWGRGATGKRITPLVTVASDPDVLPMGTAVFIPEFQGLPRDLGNTGQHDGCFLVQDRGLKVKGRHVDVFTGDPAITRLWNDLVPSNRGVTVIVDYPRCSAPTSVEVSDS